MTDPTKDFLRLTLAVDDRGNMELIADVSVRGFAGRGAAWFHPHQLVEFGRALAETFPLREPLEIRGGYWGRDPGDGVTQEHLVVRFYPIGGRGVVGCHVRLATHVQDVRRPEEQLSVRVEMTTDYQALVRFSTDLIRLVNGDAHECVLAAAVR